MSKKGLSLEEKKARLLNLFHEKKEFYQLKELEKIAPKEKGITVNSVKDVVNALVDDGTVDTDKIGGSIYFWSFPSKVMNLKKRKLEDLQSQYEKSRKKLNMVNTSLQQAEANKENAEDSSQLLTDVEALQQQSDTLNVELKYQNENNPQNIAEMKNETQPVKEAANRWTDNVFTIKSWCKKKFMMEDKVLNKQFGIPEDLDYLD